MRLALVFKKRALGGLIVAAMFMCGQAAFAQEGALPGSQASPKIAIVNNVDLETPKRTAVAPSVRAASLPKDNLLTMLSGLMIVLALIVVIAMVVKRMNLNITSHHGALKIKSVLAVGTREKIALLEVGNKQVLVGITPSSIRTLYLLDEPLENHADSHSRAAQGQSMTRKLLGLIERGRS